MWYFIIQIRFISNPMFPFKSIAHIKTGVTPITNNKNTIHGNTIRNGHSSHVIHRYSFAPLDKQLTLCAYLWSQTFSMALMVNHWFISMLKPVQYIWSISFLLREILVYFTIISNMILMFYKLTGSLHHWTDNLMYIMQPCLILSFKNNYSCSHKELSLL